MLGGATSVFPQQLADHWRRRGLDVAIVTYDRVRRGLQTPGGAPIVSVGSGLNLSPVIRGLLSMVSSIRRTPPTVDNRQLLRPMPLWSTTIGARAAAARAMRFAPDFVFGHEVYAYGPATAACSAVPRILFPWGFDIHDFAESSPRAFAAVQRSLLAADLVVPASTEAAEFIRSRFGVAPERVQSFSWGVDRAAFRRSDAAQRAAVLARHGIPLGSQIVMNVRRCNARWGAAAAVDAFARVAGDRPDVHFVALGNSSPGTAQLLDELRRRLREAGMEGRATLLENEIDLAGVRDLMAASDLFLSLPTFTDMRSLSNLQAAACGAVPIISNQEEVRRMIADGFRAQLVDPTQPEEIAAAIAAYLDAPELVESTRHANAAYLEQHEDHEANLDRMLAAIVEVCRSRR